MSSPVQIICANTIRMRNHLLHINRTALSVFATSFLLQALQIVYIKVIFTPQSKPIFRSSTIMVAAGGGGEILRTKLNGFFVFFLFTGPSHHQTREIATRILRIGRDLSSE